MRSMSKFNKVASDVSATLGSLNTSKFAKVAVQVRDNLLSNRTAADKDSEWQRVNSYIGDVLKDAHTLYAKLVRLQGDFTGIELDKLEKVSEATLAIGDELSVFARDFTDGKYEMEPSEFIYGDKGGEPIPNPEAHKEEKSGVLGRPEENEGLPIENFDVDFEGEKEGSEDEEESGEEPEQPESEEQ